MASETSKQNLIMVRVAPNPQIYCSSSKGWRFGPGHERHSQADRLLANTFGIAGFLEYYPKFKEYEAFVNKYAPYVKNKTFNWVSINGGLLPQEENDRDDSEGNLDVQVALPLIYPTRGTYYSTAGRGQLLPDLDQNITANSNEPYLEFLHYLVALPDDKLPTTLTTSYGENEQSVPAACKFAATCNPSFSNDLQLQMQIGLAISSLN